MNLSQLIQFDTLVTFLLVLFRVGGVVMVAPLLGNPQIPAMLSIGFCLLIAFTLFPFVPFSHPQVFSSDILLIKMIVQEVMIGIVLGFAAAIIFFVVQTAGEIFGFQLGFSLAKLMDPANEGASGLMSTMYVVFGSLIFLYLNGHHVIIQALAESFKVIPLGDGFNLAVGNRLSDLVAKMLTLGIKMAAPILIVLTVLKLIFGFITKLSPQLNVYFNVGLILTPILGMSTLALSLPLFRLLMTQLTGDLDTELVEVLRELKGN